jgi:uncharacterized protein (DUF2141 family)
MKKSMIVTVAFFLMTFTASLAFAQAAAAPAAAKPAKLSMSVHSFLPHLGGTARLYVFDSEDTFNEFDKAIIKKTAKISGLKLMKSKTEKGENQGTWWVVLKDIKPGTYAVSVVHDENNDGKMNQVMGFGPPKEGVGSSRPISSIPKWDKVKITIKEGEQKKISIKMTYLFD